MGSILYMGKGQSHTHTFTVTEMDTHWSKEHSPNSPSLFSMIYIGYNFMEETSAKLEIT